MRKLSETVLREHRIYLFIAGSIITAYLIIGLLFSDLGRTGKAINGTLFGFAQLDHLGEIGIPVFVATLFAAVEVVLKYRDFFLRISNRMQQLLVDNRWGRLLFSISAAGFFFLFRTQYINEDGRYYESLFNFYVPINGYFSTHDELWEFYIHSRFWDLANSLWGWDVALSYQFLSAIGGGVFMYFLITLCRELYPKTPSIMLVFLISAGYMQLFFGDIENYTLTGAIMMAYLLTSIQYLRAKTPLVVPSALLSLAMCFDLIAGIFGPSLIFFGILELRKRKYVQTFVAVIAFVLIMGSTFLFFHLSGLPISDLWEESHISASGGQVRDLAVDPSWQYYFGIFNSMSLLFPLLVLLVPLLCFKRIEMNLINVFFLICSVAGLAFILGWPSHTGIYNDYNLYGNAMVPIAILIVYNLLSNEGMKYRNPILLALLVPAFIHSYAWIISNHYFPEIQLYRVY